LPGDPLGPGPVGAGVADEEIRRLAHPPPSAHTLSLTVGLPQRAKRYVIHFTGRLPTSRRANERQPMARVRRSPDWSRRGPEGIDVGRRPDSPVLGQSLLMNLAGAARDDGSAKC